MAPELTDEVTDKLEQLGPPSAEFKMDLNLLDIVIYGIARTLFGAGLLAVGGWMLFVLLAVQVDDDIRQSPSRFRKSRWSGAAGAR